MTTLAATPTDVPFEHGKPVGCISERKNFYQVLFSGGTGIPSQTFKFSNQREKKQAYVAAAKYQKEQSDEHKLTKNKWRRVGDRIEVMLSGGRVLICDPGHLRLVEQRIWCSAPVGRTKRYAAKGKHPISKGGTGKHQLFHNVAFPHFQQVGHKNGNILDNRACNVEESSRKVNRTMVGLKSSKSGLMNITKVPVQGGRNPRWMVKWRDEDGKRRSKSFSVTKKLSDEEARQKAIDFRKQMLGL